MFCKCVGCLISSKGTVEEIREDAAGHPHRYVRSLESSCQLSYHDNAQNYKFVAGVADELEEVWISEVEAHEHPLLQDGFEEPEEEGFGKHVTYFVCLAEVVAGDQDESDEGHRWNVQIGSLQIVAWRKLVYLFNPIDKCSLAVDTPPLPVVLLQQEG